MTAFLDFLTQARQRHDEAGCVAGILHDSIVRYHQSDSAAQEALRYEAELGLYPPIRELLDLWEAFQRAPTAHLAEKNPIQPFQPPPKHAGWNTHVGHVEARA